jgi:16S rRNA (cytidine1402-2'-O)-methyltransferase
MSAVFGVGRHAVLARELTKTFETLHGDSLQGLCQWVAEDENQRKGEMVVLVHGAEPQASDETSVDRERVLAVLLEELPVKQAAQLAAKITGAKKNALYQQALQMKSETP